MSLCDMGRQEPDMAAQLRLEAARASAVPADVSVVEPQLQRIRTALERLTQIQQQVTSGRNTLDTISRQAEALRDDVRSALRQIGDALRLPVEVKNGNGEARGTNKEPGIVTVDDMAQA